MIDTSKARSEVRRLFKLLSALLAILALAAPAAADGVDILPLPVSTGCFGLESYGIPMFGDGAGSVLVAPPGPILGVYIHWVGVEDDTPPGAGTSTVTINGTPVDGTLSTPPADFAPRSDWYSWWANIGPAGGPFFGSGLVDDANKLVDVADWDGPSGTNGAVVHVIYDLGPCVDQTTIEIQTGVDWYFSGDRGDEWTELLVFDFAPVAVDRLVSFQVSHAGTDGGQADCRGGAVWMLAGTGPAPAPDAFDLLEFGGGDRARGANDGVEIVNDPFTSALLPCTPTVNPVPDEPSIDPAHACPDGAPTCPYRALAIRPGDGGDVGAEWGVIEIDVQIPANSEWVAFQLESEKDQSGESGSWSGASYLLAALPVCGDGILDPGEECDDGNNNDGDGCSSICELEPNQPPQITCLPCQRCNDPGRCDADVPCELVAATCDPNGDPVTLTCDPIGPYGVGTTAVVVTASDGIASVEEICMVDVRDCEPPTCVGPLDLDLECTSDCGVDGSEPEVTDWLDMATGADNCGAVTIDAIAPPLFARGCGAGTSTTVAWVVTDGVGLKNVCTAEVTVADSEPPEVTVVLEPVEPREPAEPGSVCSPPNSRAFKVVCSATDGCGDVELRATLVTEWHEVDGDGNCEPFSEETDVDCGDEIELLAAAPPCPARSPSSGRSPTSENVCGDPVIGGERFVLRVEATDGCGNVVVAEYDPAAEPSPLCDEVLEDGTCCPAIGSSDPGDCEVPRCGGVPFALRPRPPIGPP